MPQVVMLPQQPLYFPGRPQGYVVRVSKVNFNQPVRFIAKDDRDVTIGAGTVPQNRPCVEFLVHQNTGFTICNVGTWDMIVSHP